MVKTGVYKKRDAKMEFIRIIGMLFIVIHHMLINDIGFSSIAQGISSVQIPKYVCSAFVNCIVIIGVNLFFFLSGYFGIHCKSKKILILISKVYIYWGIGMLLAQIAEIVSYESVWEVVKELFFCITRYWYVVVYIVLYFLSPLLNCVAENITKKWIIFFFFQYVVIGCGICFIYPFHEGISNLGMNGGYSLLSGMALYLMGRWTNLHQLHTTRKSGFWLKLYVISFLINYLSVVMLIIKKDGIHAWGMYVYNNPFIFIASFSLFLFISSLKIRIDGKLERLSLILGSHTFAVYILHSCNPFFSSNRAWFIHMCENIWGGKGAFLALIPNAVIIFILYIFVDILYEYALGDVISKICGKLSCILKNIYFSFLDLAQVEDINTFKE